MHLTQAQVADSAAAARNAGLATVFYRRKHLAPLTAIAGPILIGVTAMIAVRFGQFALAVTHGRHQPGWFLLTLLFTVIATGSAISTLVFIRALARAYRQRGEKLIVVDDIGVTLDRASGAVGIPWANIVGASLQQLRHGGVFLRIRVSGQAVWSKDVPAAGVPLNLVQLDGPPDDVVRAILGHRGFKG